MEKALAAIHQAQLRQPPITLVYGSADGQVALMLKCNAAERETVLGPIAASYPQCSLVAVDAPAVPAGCATWRAEVHLTPEIYPILRHAQFEDLLNHTFADPVSSVLRAVRPEESLQCRVEISVTPASRRRRHIAREAVRLLDRSFFRTHHRLAAFFARHIVRGRWRWLAWLLGRVAARSEHPGHTLVETSTSRLHEREENVQAAADKIGGHLFECWMHLIVCAPSERKGDATERIRSMTGALGAFTRSGLATFRIGRIRSVEGRRTTRPFLLSHEELATLWHPPTATARAERMRVNDFAELEAPVMLHPVQGEGTVVLGRVRFRDDERLVTLALEDRRRHLYIVGKTGMGKTTLIQNMLADDIAAGRGVCLVDPHGDLAESIAGLVPKHRTNDVILFDVASREYVVGFNPLASRDPSRVDQVTSGVVSAFKKLHDSWGPRLEDTLRNAVFAMVEQGGNLLSVMRLLGEKQYREHVVPNIRDEVVRSFWIHEFASWSDNYRTEAVAAIQNKIRPFLTNTNMRAIVSQPGKSLDLRQIMDDGKVLIVNLSKGRIGEDNATLLGAFLVTSIQQAAMTRADIPEGERRDFFLYVDEFQNFTTGSFASVLSEARKFRLSLIVAHQYLAQINDETADAVWGNVGSIVAFQVGSDDAEVIAQQLGKYAGQITPENLSGLPKYAAYARLLIDGMPSNPFSLQTLPPRSELFDPDRAETIRRVARRRFATGRMAETTLARTTASST